MKKIPHCLILVTFMVSFCSSVFAQQAPEEPSSTDKKLKPITVSYTTLGGLCYITDDRLLSGYKDFEELVYPLRDFEATRLMKRSESSNSNARLFGIAGFAGLVTGLVGLLTTPSSQQAPFWITAAGGAALFDISGLFQSEAQTAKFNCVQRYNRFARGEEQVLPQAPQDEKSLLNFDKTSNLPPPKPEIKRKLSK